MLYDPANCEYIQLRIDCRSESMIEFIKMEATGNDYIYIDALDKASIPRFTDNEIEIMCHRHFGIGGDGLIIIGPSNLARARMHMFNNDGSESAMCGNALRSVALLVHLRTGEKEFMLESGAGVHEARILEIFDETHMMVEIEVGSPRFESEKIPFLPEKILSADQLGPSTLYSNQTAGVDGYGKIVFTTLSMGNPHMVVFVDDPDSVPVEKLGPYLENHDAYPERTNVEFLGVKENGELTLRTHERGSGETLSCGSGACAALIASALTGRGPKRNVLNVRGGTLEVEWNGDENHPGKTYLRGPARIVFRGVFSRDGMGKG